MHKISLAV